MSTKSAGLLSTPPISCTKALRNLEKAYVAKTEELERAQKKIVVLEAKIKAMKAKK